MAEENVGGSAPEGPEIDREEWAKECLKIARQEIGRAFVLGIVPYTLDRDDLESAAGLAVSRLPTSCAFGLVRTAIRRDFMNLGDSSKGYRQTNSRVLRANPQPDLDGDFDISSLHLYELLQEGLSGFYLEPIRLVYYEGMTLEEAAQRLGVSFQAVHKRLGRAYRKIEKIIFPEGLKK